MESPKTVAMSFRMGNGSLRDLLSERHAAGRALPDAVHRWIGGT